MFNKPLSLTEFILQKENGETARNLTILLNRFQYAAKIIASHVRQAGLVDIIGLTGSKNTFQDEVKKIDEFSNTVLIDVLSSSGLVAVVASEELEHPITIDSHAPYLVFFDPLDGSANIESNSPIGTIFSLYRNDGTLLHKGREQLAAGYILYGPSVLFVFSQGEKVHGFTLDPSIGSFLLSHPVISLPPAGTTYSANEAYSTRWEEPARQYLESLKKQKKHIKLRYSGAMVADIHRTLIEGGVFFYPRDTNAPQGKLRLMYEVNPLSFLITAAGGSAQTTDGENPLDILPTSVHQRTPILLGSKEDVALFSKSV